MHPLWRSCRSFFLPLFCYNIGNWSSLDFPFLLRSEDEGGLAGFAVIRAPAPVLSILVLLGLPSEAEMLADGSWCFSQVIGDEACTSETKWKWKWKWLPAGGGSPSQELRNATVNLPTNQSSGAGCRCHFFFRTRGSGSNPRRTPPDDSGGVGSLFVSDSAKTSRKIASNFTPRA